MFKLQEAESLIVIDYEGLESKTPPTKLFLPRVTGTTRLDTVGGSGPDFSAVVTGHITQAEGSFDSVTGVTANPSFSLQLTHGLLPDDDLWRDEHDLSRLGTVRLSFQHR